jgi:hypothetical protein
MPADRKNTANKIDMKTSARPNGSLEKNYNLFLSAFNTVRFRHGSGTMFPTKPILAAGYSRPPIQLLASSGSVRDWISYGKVFCLNQSVAKSRACFALTLASLP